jgi:hypothetical protein
VATAASDSAREETACGTFDALMSYVDQVTLPEIERLCAPWRPQQAGATAQQ